MDSLCAAAAASSSSRASAPAAVDSSSVANSRAAAAMEGSDLNFGARRRRDARNRSSRAGKIAGRLVCGLLTCVFAIVGALVGAVIGALIGLATESGLFRGAGVGAISGAVFAIDAVESTLVIWRTRGMWSVLFVVLIYPLPFLRYHTAKNRSPNTPSSIAQIDILVSLVSGRLVREKVDPAVQNAVQSQMSAVSSPFHEIPDIFETGGSTGMSRGSVNEIPTVSVTKENCVDSCGDRISCSVCLHDLQIGEIVRSLPTCGHLYHVSCIDSWLLRHGSCPLCRRDFQGLSSFPAQVVPSV